MLLRYQFLKNSIILYLLSRQLANTLVRLLAILIIKFLSQFYKALTITKPIRLSKPQTMIGFGRIVSLGALCNDTDHFFIDILIFLTINIVCFISVITEFHSLFLYV